MNASKINEIDLSIQKLLEEKHHLEMLSKSLSIQSKESQYSAVSSLSGSSFGSSINSNKAEESSKKIEPLDVPQEKFVDTAKIISSSVSSSATTTSSGGIFNRGPLKITKDRFFTILNEKLSDKFLQQSLQSNNSQLYELKTTYLDKILHALDGLRINSMNIDYEEIEEYLADINVKDFQEKLELFLLGYQVLRPSRPNGSKASKDSVHRQDLLNFLQASWFQLGLLYLNTFFRRSMQMYCPRF
jgi:hypothetical protein